MPPLRLSAARGPLGLFLLCLLAACQDTAPTGPAAGPQFDISEARFGDGNPDFFFHSPLAANPSSTDPTFDPGASNGALTPYLRVCETPLTNAPSDPSGCSSDVTEAVTGSATGLAMRYQPDSEVYQVNFSTTDLDPAKAYRLEIWGVGFDTEDRDAILSITFPADVLNGGPRWLFGWRDIANSPSTAACTGEEAYCLMRLGTQTVPVKVRIEDFAFCPATRNCATQFVASGTDANLEALFGPGAAATSAQLYIPGQAGTDFAISFEPCSPEDEAAVRGYAQFPVFGPCVKTIVPPIYDETIVLDDPLTVSYCEEIDMEAIESQLAHPATQLEQVNIHHFSTAGNPNGPIQKAQALPETFPMCGDPTAGGFASVEPERSLIRLAADAGKRLQSLFGPTPLLALDRGGGGQSAQPESFFMFGMSGKFEYELEGDDVRTALAGSDVTLRVKVTDGDGNPVMGARPEWSLASAPGPDASVDVPVSGWPLTLTDGISQATVTLSATGGNNVFHAGGIGLADPREDDCTVPGGVAGAALCNGPIVNEYDTFRPITDASLGGVIDIPDDTFLPFTVFGCTPGFGTPASIDGTLAPGEWDCANTRTFDVNLSGGSTVQATLYWMNDATDFHIAVSVPGTDRRNKLRVEWDNSGDGDAVAERGVYTTARAPGDDVWEFDPRSGPADKFIDDGCSGSGQSGCGENDGEFGGSMQTEAAFNNSVGGVTVYEMSHPLSGDSCNRGGRMGCGDLQGDPIDIGLGSEDDAGFFVTLSLGNGAQGDTQDPGFLQYLKVVIR